MGYYLAIEASANSCSVALQYQEDVFEVCVDKPRQHNQVLLPAIMELLESKNISALQLSGVCFSAGPGSFTGLRMSTGITQGLAFAAKCPVVPVSSLQCLATTWLQQQTIQANSYVWVLEDARMGDVYSAVYQWQDDGWHTTQADCLQTQQECLQIKDQLELSAAQPGYLLGSAWDNFSEDDLQAKHFLAGQHVSRCEKLQPRATALLKLARGKFESGQTVDAQQALPVYLRENIIWKKWQKKVDKLKQTAQQSEGMN